MLYINEDKLNEIKSEKYKVYSKYPLSNGIECFPSSKCFKHDEKFYITSVPISNIKCEGDKFFFTEESLSDVADWWPASIINVKNKFTKCKNFKHKCTSQISDKTGEIISDRKCVVDVSGLPAFNGVNEDVQPHEYRFYLTLFNDYTVKQLQYERHDLFDAKFNSTKFDLVDKMQNSDFLKSKDFAMINSKRADSDSICIGIVLKEDNNEKYSMNFGKVFIDMNNIVSIKWH